MDRNKAAMVSLEFDAVVVGAGFSGLYMLYRLRQAGLSARVLEAAANVGGTWYHNRYPGCACDAESIYYTYTFSDDLLREWNWSQRFASQPEILRYLNHVADRFDLRKDVQFHTRVTAAHFDGTLKKWRILTQGGGSFLATYFITAVGALSAANVPDFKGLDRFEGSWYHTGQWPHGGVDFTDKRVGVIGTGSSAVQAIPPIAKAARHLTVFQRTPGYCVPAGNHPYDEEAMATIKARYGDILKKRRESWAGLGEESEGSALDASPEERHALYEQLWLAGTQLLFNSYTDLLTNEEANKTAADFVRQQIREIVHDPITAGKLMPTFFIGTKRLIRETGYYATFNRPNVNLVDVRTSPIEEITSKGLRTTSAEYRFDTLVFATGYDAITGTLFRIDIRGRGGMSLESKWAGGAHVRTYLGLSTAGFPNMFMITGPESPSVLSNMAASIEQHVEWIAECITHLRHHDAELIEPSEDAEAAWSQHCKEVADTTLFPRTASWYTGANIAGKPRGFPIYVGGIGKYRAICDDVAKNGYKGFLLR